MPTQGYKPKATPSVLKRKVLTIGGGGSEESIVRFSTKTRLAMKNNQKAGNDYIRVSLNAS